MPLYPEIVQQLLAHNAVDVNMKGEEGEGYTGTPLFVAAAKGHAEIVQQLLAHSAVDVNMEGRGDANTGTPLFMAAAEGYPEIVQQLLAHSAVGVNMKGRGDGYTGTPLLVAAAKGQAEIVQQLLAHSAVDVNMEGSDKRGYTSNPLSVAVGEGRAEIVQQLLAHSAIDVNLQGNGGETALLRAAREGNETMFRQLVRHAAINPHLRNQKGETVLMIAIAAKQQSTEILQWSLDQCDVNSQNNGGETALFIAANSGNERIVQQLLAHDTIDANLTTTKGETPLTVAARKDHVKVVRLLLEHCIDVDVYSGQTSDDEYQGSIPPTLRSSIPPILLAILLGDGSDDDKFAITQEIIKHSTKHMSNIPSIYHGWRSLGAATTPGQLTLLESLLASITPSEIILSGIRNGILTSSRLINLLGASPSKVEITRDIIVTATPADLSIIPTMDQGNRTPGLAQVLITSHNTAFNFEAYLYSSRDWPQTIGKFTRHKSRDR